MTGQGAPLTFLFTDIVGSTLLWQRHGDAMQAALESHDAVLGAVIEEHAGTVFAGGGDGLGAVFADPAAGVEAALGAQRSLSGMSVGGDPLLVRMGLHTGIAQERNGDYFGLSVNRAARVAAAANGGQVLATSSTAELVHESIQFVRLGEFRLADLLEPVEVLQAGPGAFPPIKALDPEHHNLPVRFTSVVGREQLIDSVIDRMMASRLVTLVGPGGIGKTTVALEVGAALATRVDRGVWLVELDEIVEGVEVDPRIAAAVGLAPIEGWHRTAAGRDHVVVLDNAEHVVEDVAAAVAGLLRAGSRIRFLVTSRESLGIPGEVVVELDPLEAEGEGVSLLLDRAPDLLGEPDDLAELVRLTDGVPLAIELVAAHATRIPLNQLLSSVRDHGFGGLTVRGVADRHSSASAAVEWSYSLLSEEEKRSFEALAVFSQDFTREAGQAVARSSPFAFTSLVEKSLVQRTDHGYRLLETIKEFARGRLLERNAWGEASGIHARYIADHVSALAARLPPRPGEDWLAELSVSLTDAGQAFRWALEVSDDDLLERLFVALPGPFGVDRSELAGLVEVLSSFVPDLIEALPATRWLLFRFAWCEDLVGREPSAADKALLLQPVADDVGDDYLRAAATFLLMRARPYSDTSIEEFEAMAEAVTGYRAETEWWEQSALLSIQGAHRRAHGDLVGAERIMRRALELPVVTEFNRLLTMSNLAETLSDSGRPAEALEIWRQVAGGHATSLMRANPVLRYDALQGAAHAHIALHEPQVARRLINELVAEDLKERQPTTAAFCAVADYHREIGDHRASVWFLAKMLKDRPPFAKVHLQIIEEAQSRLGEDFEGEWRRGADMDIFALYALIQES